MILQLLLLMIGVSMVLTWDHVAEAFHWAHVLLATALTGLASYAQLAKDNHRATQCLSRHLLDQGVHCPPEQFGVQLPQPSLLEVAKNGWKELLIVAVGAGIGLLIQLAWMKIDPKHDPW